MINVRRVVRQKNMQVGHYYHGRMAEGVGVTILVVSCDHEWGSDPNKLVQVDDGQMWSYQDDEPVKDIEWYDVTFLFREVFFRVINEMVDDENAGD